MKVNAKNLFNLDYKDLFSNTSTEFQLLKTLLLKRLINLLIVLLSF